jgi:hypothetical protein
MCLTLIFFITFKLIIPSILGAALDADILVVTHYVTIIKWKLLIIKRDSIYNF